MDQEHRSPATPRSKPYSAILPPPSIGPPAGWRAAAHSGGAGRCHKRLRHQRQPDVCLNRPVAASWQRRRRDRHAGARDRGCHVCRPHQTAGVDAGGLADLHRRGVDRRRRRHWGPAARGRHGNDDQWAKHGTAPFPVFPARGGMNRLQISPDRDREDPKAWRLLGASGVR